MRLYTQFATLLLCLLIAGCSNSSVTLNNSAKTITLDTKGLPKNLTIFVNDEPQLNKTNNGEIILSVPSGQSNIIKVKNENPTIIYQVKIPQESKDLISLKIEPMDNKELNQQVANFLNDYLKAVNQKKNALSFLSKDSIFNPKEVYNHSFKSAVIYTTSFKSLMLDEKPELIMLVDAENRETPSATFTYEFRLLWEEGNWKIFHQRILYEVSEGKLLYEYEKGTYPGKQSPTPEDLVLSF
jgi:uncharacterized protein YcfL